MKTKTNWHLIHTKPTQELNAQIELERQGYATYLPKVEKPKRNNHLRQSTPAPLFPRYLFIQLTAGIDNWAPIRSTRGVSNLVRFGMLPAVISDETVHSIISQENKNGLHTIATPTYSKNDSVRLTQGPFADFQAIFKEKRASGRVLILLNLLGNASQVEISQDHLAPA